MANNREISLYVDALIVEALATDPRLFKKADGPGPFDIQSIKNYFMAHVNPNDKVGSFLNIIAPGAILITFASLNMPWIGLLLGLAASVFHIDVSGILKSIHSSIKELLSGGSLATSQQVDKIVSQAVSAGTGPATMEEAAAAQQKLTGSGSDFSPSDDGILSNKSIAFQIRQAKLLKLAMIHYETQLEKRAGLGEFFNIFSSKKAGTSSILSRVLSFFFKLALASAGLMVAGDAINAFLGRSSAFTGTLKDGKPTLESSQSTSSSSGSAPANLPAAPVYKPTQTKFKVRSSYREEQFNVGVDDRWIERYPSNITGIENMVLDFANQVYENLENKTDIIRSSPGFKGVVEIIAFHNKSHVSHGITMVPRIYHTKKQIVDTFIDDVARRS